MREFEKEYDRQGQEWGLCVDAKFKWDRTRWGFVEF